jgi:MscS family membrane protein
MTSLLRRSSIALLCLLFSLPVAAQVSLSQIVPGTSTSKETPSVPIDALGRQTPSGTFFGFLQDAQSSKFDLAAQYLQMSNAKRQTQGEEMSRELLAVLNLMGNLRSISTNPEGTPQVGLPPDRERVGTISIDDRELDIVLARVDSPAGGKIWLFSSETLAQIPDLYENVQTEQVETKLPGPLRRDILYMAAWQWLAVLLAIPLAAGLAWLLVQFVSLPNFLWRRHRNQLSSRHWSAVSAPLWLLFGVAIHAIVTKFLRLPLLHRHYYYRITAVVLVVALAWLTLRFLTRGLDLLRARAIARGSAGTGSLVLLGQRIIKVLVILFAGLGILGALGFNMTTALAGLGIGGLAIGFGAQKTIENLFGGVSVLADEVIRVGDTCNFNGRVGTIEDISLRSTRIRTVERTELAIPNGTLATMNIENLTRRDKILFNPTLGLRYETTADQLRFLLAETRRLLYEHPKVETASARIRFAGFLDSSLSLEIFSYILTKDMAEYTAIREDMLLRIMDIVADSGTGFAFPSQTVYLGKDEGMNPDKAARAAAKVAEWREGQQLPFPDFAQTEISQFRDSLPYPPPESAVNNKKW